MNTISNLLQKGVTYTPGIKALISRKSIKTHLKNGILNSQLKYLNLETVVFKMVQLFLIPDEQIKMAFNMADTNKDGKLGKSEIKSLLVSSNSNLEQKLPILTCFLQGLSVTNFS